MTMEFEKESVKPDDEQDIQPDRKLSIEAAQTTPDSSEHMSKHLPGVKARESEYIPPNGGLAAWLCVLAGFFVFVNSWGILTTWGVFQSYYQRDLLSHESPSSISWIGSAQSTLVTIMGILVGPLTDRGYLRPVMFVGSFMLVFGMMMTSISSQYYQIMLAQGICVGMGAGLIYIPALAVISTQFTTRRPIALGCASTGAAIGGIIFPIMFHQLQPAVGFGWAVRAIAFINLGLCVVILMILCRKPGRRTPKARMYIDLRAFKERSFGLFAIGLFFQFLAYYIPLFYIPSYATSRLGTSEEFAFYLLAISNAGSFFGRVLPYILGSRVKPIQVLVFWDTAGVVVLFAWIGVTTTAGFIVWCIVWGFISGVLVTAPAASIPHPMLSPSLDVIGARLGMSWSTAAVGVLIGGPIAGALADVAAAHFLHAQVLAGAIMAAAVFFLSWPLISVYKYDRTKVREVKA